MKNIEKNSWENINVVCAAIGKEVALSNCYRHEGHNMGLSSLVWRNLSVKIEKTILLSGDFLIQKCHVPELSTIKIDVEGTTAEVLRGLEATLSGSNRQILIFECFESEFTEVKNLLLAYGYLSIQKIDEYDNYLAISHKNSLVN